MGGAVHLYLGDVGIGSLGSRRKFTARQALLLGEERRTLLYEVRLVYGRRWQQEGIPRKVHDWASPSAGKRASRGCLMRRKFTARQALYRWGKGKTVVTGFNDHDGTCSW